MKRVLSGVAASIVLFGTGATIAAEDDKNRTVEQYTCKDVMRETGSNRDASIAFLHGFFLGKGGSSSFNLDTLTKQTDTFIDNCLDNPGKKAVDVMADVKK